MNKRTVVLWMTMCLLAVIMQSAFGQNVAKKPTITILPSDNWCATRYFMTTYDNQGTEVKIPDYQTAFQQDSELPMVIANVGALLTDCGYSIKDAEQELKAITARAQEDNVTTSSTSRSYLAETPLDVLKRRVKADVLLQIWWKVNKEAVGHSVSFTLEAFDTYTSKRIATYSGTSAASEEIIPRLLATTIKDNIATFDQQLTSWYNKMEANGREIVLTVKCWDNWDKNLETEYDGKELTDCIAEWIAANTVQGQYNLSDGTENFAQFEQVMIPLCDANGKAMDARSFAVQLQRFLKKEPYSITAKVMIRGLGEAILVLGEK